VPVVVVVSTLLVARLELTEGTATAVVPLDVGTVHMLDVKWLLSAAAVLTAFASSWLLMLVVLVSTATKGSVVVLALPGKGSVVVLAIVVVVLVIVVTKVCVVVVVVLVAVSVVVVCVDVAQSHHCISLPSCVQQPRDLQWAAVIACLSCGRTSLQRRLLSLYEGQPGPVDLILI